MKRFVRHGIYLSFFVLLTGAMEASGQDMLRKVLQRLDDHNKALTSLRADVTMVKYDSQLGAPDTIVGKTAYLPKQKATKDTMYIRIDWVKPEEQIAIIGEQYELFRPRLNQVIQGTVDKSKNSSAAGGALAFMNMSRDRLKQNYDVVYIGEEQLQDPGRTKAWHLQMTPKTPTSYKLAELWVDGDGMPRMGRITERNNDTTSVLLTNPQKNVKINTNEFKLKYDKRKVTITKQ